MSHLLRNWQLVDTEFDGQTMTIRHTPKDGAVWYAYFPPYPAYRMEDRLVALSEIEAPVDVFFFGRSVLGQRLVMVRLGNDCQGTLALGVHGACASCMHRQVQAVGTGWTGCC